VGLVDVAPTLRDLCGLPEVPADGSSLRPALSGKTLVPRPVYMEALESLYSFGWAPLYGLADQEMKFILAPKKELYRLDQDPHEKNNLLPAQSAAARPLEAELKKRIASAHPVSQKGMPLDQEELKSLQSLGYIAGGPASPSAGAATTDPKDEISMVRQYEEAVRLQQEGKSQEAASRLTALTKRSPRNSLFFYQLGRSLEVSNPAGAAAAYKKSIQCRTDFPQPYIRLIWVLETQGKQGEAYAVANLALKETSDYTGEVHVLLAWAAYELGRPVAEVEAALEEGGRIAGGDSGVALKLRALMALRRGDREAAIRFLQAMADAATPADVAMLGGDGRFRELKDDPRFWTLVIRAQKQVEASGEAN
jgi:tetratricopeptide (TPR) repeat protein